MNMTKVLTHHSGDSLSFEFRVRMCPDIQRELGVEPRGGLDLRKPPGPLGGFPDTPNKGETLGKILYLIWNWNTSESSITKFQEDFVMLLGRRTSGIPCLTCCHY